VHIFLCLRSDLRLSGPTSGLLPSNARFLPDGPVLERLPTSYLVVPRYLNAITSLRILIFTGFTHFSSVGSTSQQVSDQFHARVMPYDIHIPITQCATGNKPPSTVPAKGRHSVFEIRRACKNFGTAQLSSPPFFPMLSILVSPLPAPSHQPRLLPISTLPLLPSYCSSPTPSRYASNPLHSPNAA
jgi:hypothetical protein